MEEEGDVVKQCVVKQVQGRGGEGRREGERGEGGGGDSPAAALRPSARIMADGPRCARRKQANPRRNDGRWISFCRGFDGPGEPG